MVTLNSEVEISRLELVTMITEEQTYSYSETDLDWVCTLINGDCNLRETDSIYPVSTTSIKVVEGTDLILTCNMHYENMSMQYTI